MSRLRPTLLAILLAALASACAWDRTRPVEIVPYAGDPLARETQLSLIGLRSVVTGKPVRETVWENGAGARWDPRASTRIGFAQSYVDPVEQIGAGSILSPGAVGVARIAPAPPRTISRISVPLGRLLIASLESAAGAPARFAVCDANECDAASAQLAPDARVADLELRFAVWEEPLNHLNLAARVDVTCARGAADATRSAIVHSRLSRPLSPGGLSWHSEIVQRMNDEAGQFAHEVSERALAACPS